MSSLAAAHGLARPRGTATIPTYFGSFGAAASAASVAPTLPASLADGDIGILVVNTDPNAAITTPSGWTLIAPMKGDNGSATPSTVCYLFKRTLTAALSSTTVTVARAAASVGPISAAGIVIRGGSDVGVGPAISRNTLAVVPAGKTVKLAAIKPGKRDLVLAFHTARAYTNVAAGAAQMVTPPSGFTTRQNRSAAYIAGVSVEWAASIMDGPATSADGVALTGVLTDQSYMIGGLLSISPSGRRPTDKLPASLANQPLHGYGTSYLGYVSDATAHPSEALWYDRIARLMGTPSTDNNLGLPGAMATDICGYAYGGVSYASRAVALDPNFSVAQIGTWMSQTGRSGLILCDLLGNDAINDADTTSGGTTAKSRAGARAAAESLVRLLRASSMVQQTHASVVFTGTWSDVSATDYSGGSCKGTTTAGDVSTITVTETDIDVVLFAIDDSALAQVGADYTIHVDGVLHSSGTTSDRMRKSSSATFHQSAYCALAIPVRDMGPGSHTIVVTHAGANGEGLYCDGYLIPNPTPPLIVLNGLAHYDPAILAALPSSNAIFDIYTQIAHDIAALFPDGRVMVYDPLENGLWDYTTMVTSYDSIHLSEPGAAHYTRGIVKLLSETVA